MTLLALGACTPERPKGAYNPVYVSTDPCGDFDCPMDGGTTSDVDAGEDTTNPTSDAATIVVPPTNDAGQVVIDPANPLEYLAGNYLMRVDYYSTPTATSSGSTLALKTRVSNFFFVTLTASGTSTLNATETYCDQISAHQCETGCSAWSTLYSNGRLAKIRAMAPLSRSYQVDASGNMTVSADGAILRVGYDDTQTSTAAVPTTYTDSRVWMLSTASDRQRGMATSLQGTLLASGLSLTLNCEVDTVQLYTTAFKAALGANLTAAELANHVMTVTTTGEAGNVIQALGDPTQVCNVQSLQTTTDNGEKVFARFMPTDQTGCPADGPRFETLFPVLAGANLDPPQPTD